MKVSELESKLETAVLASEPVQVQNLEVLPEEHFHRMVRLERKRAERSGKPFLLMLLDTGRFSPSEKNGRLLQNVFSALALSARGYRRHRLVPATTSVVGVMFTEIAGGSQEIDHGDHACFG